MDCRSALEILDCTRAGSHDLQEPELFDAKTHVETCAACDETFRERQMLDRRIGELMRDVAVPVGLFDRLSAAVVPTLAEEKLTVVVTPAENVTPLHRATAPASAPTQLRRRRMRIAAGLAACLSLVAAIWIFSGKSAPTLTVDKIRDTVPLEQSVVEQLDAFDERFAAALPGGGWDSQELDFDVMKGFGKSRKGGHQMALVLFTYPARDKSDLMGMLAIIPKDAVKDADTLGTSFASGQGNYTNRDSEVYATVSWTAGDFVYVCFVPDTEEARERLRQVLISVPA
ncbi:MAG: hypothetical protein WD648_12540 [Planctomycetaceae bacterium]